MSNYASECTNLATGERKMYTLMPAMAVVCAHEQEHGNFNTWEYDYSQVELTPSGKHWTCGDWTCTTVVTDA